MHEKGNALFLILIAVALFAALSYAVTQSGRSGGGIDKENLIIKTTEFMEQGTLIRSHIQRLYVLNQVDQVRFDSANYNASGTVYPPDSATTTTGETIGVFNKAEGIPKIYPPLELYKSIGSDTLFAWTLFSHTRLQVNTVDVGTASGDEFLRVMFMTQAACELINKSLTGSATVPVYTNSGTGRYYKTIKRDGTTGFATNGNDTIDVGVLPGCSVTGSTYGYYELIKEN